MYDKNSWKEFPLENGVLRKIVFHKNWNSNNAACSGYKTEFESLGEDGIKFICIVQ